MKNVSVGILIAFLAATTACRGGGTESRTPPAGTAGVEAAVAAETSAEAEASAEAPAGAPAGGSTGTAAAETAAGAPPLVTTLPALPFDRIAVIGASVSAGFGSIRVAKALDETIRTPHETGDFAQVFFFQDPFGEGQRQVARAVEFRPTVVYALDFLFWYAYGSGWTLAEREHNVDLGLRQLERLDAPILVGDVPDMTGAADWMLDPAQIPPLPELAALNARIRAWAEGRPNVLLLPLSEWTAPLHATAPVVVDDDGRTVAPRELMAPDGLHPNAAGVRYLLRQTHLHARVRLPGPPPR
ncbi:MAG: SGNH/GDSL hydrolase family protein [Deltaproteobacteria bacterium]|nr:SGNH/GDSL hydrolase family protein [Deltaproteobacteria bacterium]